MTASIDQLWYPIQYAPEGVLLETKVDDDQGIRLKMTLAKWDGVWFTPYVDPVEHTPTHFRHVQE